MSAYLGYPRAICGNPRTICGNPRTIYGNPGTIWDNLGHYMYFWLINCEGMFHSHSTYSDRVASLQFGLGMEPEHDLSTTLNLVLDLELS